MYSTFLPPWSTPVGAKRKEMKRGFCFFFRWLSKDPLVPLSERSSSSWVQGVSELMFTSAVPHGKSRNLPPEATSEMMPTTWDYLSARINILCPACPAQNVPFLMQRGRRRRYTRPSLPNRLLTPPRFGEWQAGESFRVSLFWHKVVLICKNWWVMSVVRG